MSFKTEMAARLSLCFLWIFTGITSVFLAKDIGHEVLQNVGFSLEASELLIISGSLLDGILGIWLLLGRHLKACYLIQLFVIVIYSVLLTIFSPDFWFHPFGPLTKNLPIMVLIYYLYEQEECRSLRE